MARPRENSRPSKRAIEQYSHKDKKRVNNPPVGLVTPETDKDAGKQKYAYDPHLDPALQWAGKAERTSFEVPTVSLHVHERIDPRSIIEAVRKKNGVNFDQLSLFRSPEENPPIRDAIEFYKHKHNWTNRLIAGDSLLVMNSLLQKEGMAGKVQMVYIDPPYGIKYGSNFQPFVNNRTVKDGKDEDLTQEPETLKAFRDTWELGLHSYLTYIRDRLLLAKELLSESGSCFLQMSDENVHFVRNLMDEVFGKENFVSQICFVKAGALGATLLPRRTDNLLFYAKDKEKVKYRQLLLEKEFEFDSENYDLVEMPDKSIKRVAEFNGQNFPKGAKPFRYIILTKPGPGSKYEVIFKGRTFNSGSRWWGFTQEGLKKLIALGRIAIQGNNLSGIRYFDDFPAREISNLWVDTATGSGMGKIYVVQSATKVIQRCLLMSTDPGDLVIDPTCGSGTTAYVAEQWGRRWITCDTSRVSIALAKQRLMIGTFDYYELAHHEEGVSSGFKYKTVPHITLGSIANNEPPGQEALYDQPFVDSTKVRVTSPFTVEAVPAVSVKPLDDIEIKDRSTDLSVVRSGETLRQAEWRDELLKTGIRGKGGQHIHFSRVEPLGGTRWLNSDAETREDKPQRVVISFGPEHAPLEQRQVARALEEAQALVPKPKIVVFAAFQFDPEASKDIDEINWPGVAVLKAQMNGDLLTEDLKKKRSSNESFWLIGQPDIQIEKVKAGDHKGKYRVKVCGFDYYDTRTGKVDSGGTEKIAMWMLDTDYDGRSLFPRQVFFPMSGDGEGWTKLAKNLKAEIDETLIESYRGAESIPFEKGDNKRVAVKLIDDRGIESLRILELE